MSLANTIIYGDKSTLRSMLEAGGDVDELDEYGFRPLIEAAIMNKTDMAELLLEYGADVDQQDSTGRTALHWAVENNNIPLCKLLLSHHANPNHYTANCTPILVNPILRGQTALKNLLYNHSADLDFSLDFINAKLLGHRFELIGQADIVAPDKKNKKFVELDFEGFFLEFTIDIILQSLERYRNHFAARNLRKYFKYVRHLVDAFRVAAELIKYQQYSTDLKLHAAKIDGLLNRNLLIIPVAHRGHAITFVRFGNLWAKCDRGENSLKEGSINIYRIHNKSRLEPEFFKQLMYIRQSPDFIAEGYKHYLNLEHITRIPLASQITGNCSWANVEAAIPAILFLLMAQEKKQSSESLRVCIEEAMVFYSAWCEWDKDRSLYDCLKAFEKASPARKASKAAVMGAVLFQCCYYKNPKDIEYAEKILRILAEKPYRYVLESYLDIYYRRQKTLPGENLIHLLDMCGLAW